MLLIPDGAIAETSESAVLLQASLHVPELYTAEVPAPQIPTSPLFPPLHVCALLLQLCLVAHICPGHYQHKFGRIWGSHWVRFKVKCCFFVWKLVRVRLGLRLS